MEYDWYFVINRTEFEESELTSREVTVRLTNIGLKTFLVTKGNLTSIFVDETFLSLDLNDKDPFEFNGFAIATDENDDIYYGIAVEE